MDEERKHVEELVRDGYINEKGMPLKCHCGCVVFESKPYYEDYRVIEEEWTCRDCGKQVGVWAYGAWQLYAMQ